MKKTLLVFGAIAILGGNLPLPARAVPTVQIAENREEQPAEFTAGLLTLEDLPDGFRELPPGISDQVSQQFLALSSQFQQGGLEPQEFFVFYHPTSLEIVFGFTGEIANIAFFDASLQLLKESPDLQQTIIDQIQEELKNIPIAELTELRIVPTEEMADNVIGVEAGMKVLGMSFQGDLISFRRDSTGGFAAVMYRQARSPQISADALAGKMDVKIVGLAGEDRIGDRPTE
ncbi:MAG: hypothetical protein AAGA60_12720 [Cyanobacteria bacterium P01_E01_bin.42]